MAVHARNHSRIRRLCLADHLLAWHDERYGSLSDEFQFRAADGHRERRMGGPGTLLLPWRPDTAHHLGTPRIYGAVSRAFEKGYSATHAWYCTASSASAGRQHRD